MDTTARLLEQNRRWAARVTAADPQFFRTLSLQQTPEYLWIGCSDSRVPANQVVDLRPGEVFVHRNVANVVLHTDLNCLSVLQFSIDVLKVRHVIVCGHYGCGGVLAAYHDRRHGLIDNWLRQVRLVHDHHRPFLDQVPDETARVDRLCELHVVEQAANVCDTTVVRDAWARGQELTVHSWVYGLHDGLIHDLGLTVDRADALPGTYAAAVRTIEKQTTRK